VKHSAKIVTDSNATGKKLEKLYGLLPENWKAIGLLPRRIEPSRNVAILPRTNYVIYPARKWRHKNHQVLYKALRLLRDEGVETLLVETGSDKGYAASLKRFAKKLGVDDLILDLGLVEKADLALLVQHSKGLVMPSRLGPTNLPPLEALSLGVPVAVSDAHQFENDVMGHLIVCRPESPSEWALAIKSMILRDQGNTPELAFSTLNAAQCLREIIGGRH
jgi:glycosyltransferase involved in cell wall biosynthesis